MDVIWRSDDTILSSGKENVLLRNTRNGETDKIIIGKHAFTDICLHWLDSQSENKYRNAIQKIANRIEVYDDTGYPKLAELLDAIDVIVGDCLQDIVKREPEIAPCPNPECGERKEVSLYVYKDDDNSQFVICDTCGYRGPYAFSKSEAIRLHNLICGKGE